MVALQSSSARHLMNRALACVVYVEVGCLLLDEGLLLDDDLGVRLEDLGRRLGLARTLALVQVDTAELKGQFRPHRSQLLATYNLARLPELDGADDLLAEAPGEGDQRAQQRPREAAKETTSRDRGRHEGVQVQADEEELVEEAEEEQSRLVRVVLGEDPRDVLRDLLVRARTGDEGPAG